MPVLYKPGHYVCNFVLFLNAIDMQNFQADYSYNFLSMKSIYRN